MAQSPTAIAARTAAPAPTPSSDLPAKTVLQAQAAARRLARVLGVRHPDDLDLLADLHVRLLTARSRHDPHQGSMEAFLRSVIDLWYWSKAKRTKMAMGSPVARAGDAVETAPGREPDPASRVDAAALRSLIDSLPPRERELAHLLTRFTPAEIADQLGLHRGTVLRRAQALAAHFEEFAPSRTRRATRAGGPQRGAFEKADGRRARGREPHAPVPGTKESA